MIKKGVLKKDTYFYFGSPEREPMPLLDNKVISWHSHLLQRIRIPKGSQVIACKNTLYIFCDGVVVSAFKLNNKFFFKVSADGKESPPHLIVLPNGPPPPYPLSLLS